MKEIKLTQGQTALVDDEDYEFLMQWKWSFRKDKHKFGYAFRSQNYYHPDGKRSARTVYMQIAISDRHGLNLKDHKDGNSLNNQKDNLRPATVQQNVRNKRKSETRKYSSKYKGVQFCKRSNLFISRIRIDKDRIIEIGRFPFDKEKEAAIAYNLSAIQYFGEYAWLNQI